MKWTTGFVALAIMAVFVAPAFADGNNTNTTYTNTTYTNTTNINTTNTNTTGTNTTNVTTNTTVNVTNTTQHAVTIWDIGFRQIGNAFDDFAFRIRSALVFDQAGRIALLNERNAQLHARQQAWVDMKQDAMKNFSNLTVDDRKELRSAIKDEHESIVNERQQLVKNMKDLKKEKDDHDDNNDEHVNDRTGNGEHPGPGLNLTFGRPGNFTAAQAEMLVEKRFGINGTVSTATRNGENFYVISGAKTETAGIYQMTRTYAVWVNTATGIIATVDLNTHINTNANTSVI